MSPASFAAAFAGKRPQTADSLLNRSRIPRRIRLRKQMTLRNLRSRLREMEGLILPAILLLTGLILIGGDHVGILSLDRIENLWPVALILVGLSDLLTGKDENAPAEQSRRSSSKA